MSSTTIESGISKSSTSKLAPITGHIGAAIGAIAGIGEIITGSTINIALGSIEIIAIATIWIIIIRRSSE